MNQNAVFTFAGNILKTDIFDFARFCVVVAVKGGQYNRLCRAQPSGDKSDRHQYVAEITDALCTDFYGGRGGNQRTARNEDVFARAVFRIAL